MTRPANGDQPADSPPTPPVPPSSPESPFSRCSFAADRAGVGVAGRRGGRRVGVRGGVGVGGALLVAGLLAVSGCSTPLDVPTAGELRRSVLESARRELEDARKSPEARRLPRDENVTPLGLRPEIIEQLDGLSGLRSYGDQETPLGPDLFGNEQRVVSVSLERSIRSAVRNNLNVEFARLAPMLRQADVVAAEAAFDWTFFSNARWSSTDRPQTSPSVGGATVGVSADQRQVVDFDVGLRRQLASGGQVTFQHSYSYTDVESANFFTNPDPAHGANLLFRLDQPLLRGVGSDVTQASIRLARNTERDTVQQLRSDLITTVTETEAAYWTLVRVHHELEVLYRLYQRGLEVLTIIEGRLRIDQTDSNLADARATVENRRADVLQSQRNVRAASDQLKVLMNDSELSIGSEVLLLPLDRPIEEVISTSVLESMTLALERRPEIARALLSIDDTSIRRRVAENARLPRLDMAAQLQVNALAGSYSAAYDNLTDAKFVDYIVSMLFEQPIGNRAAEAEFRRATLTQMQAVIAFRNTTQGVISEVKQSLRDLVTNSELIAQRRQARYAAAERLRTRDVERRFTATYTPGFLDLWLRDQERLAAAEQAEIGAITNYNIALASYHRSMGTTLERNNIVFDAPDPFTTAPSNPMFPLMPRFTDPLYGERESGVYAPGNLLGDIGSPRGDGGAGERRGGGNIPGRGDGDEPAVGVEVDAGSAEVRRAE